MRSATHSFTALATAQHDRDKVCVRGTNLGRCHPVCDQLSPHRQHVTLLLHQGRACCKADAVLGGTLTLLASALNNPHSLSAQARGASAQDIGCVATHNSQGPQSACETWRRKLVAEEAD